MKKGWWVDGLLVAGLICVTVGVGLGMRQGSATETKVEVLRQAEDQTISVTQVLKKVQIDISGEVVNPGVYEVNEGARVNEVLVKAGGLGLKADRDWVEKNINRAAVVHDGEKIYIPAVNEQTTNYKTQTSNNIQAPNNGVLGVETGKVSLNRATVAELDTLSGVGPAIAQKIVDYRQKQGGFVSIEEIKLVSGVGEKLFEKIKDNLSL